MRLAGYTLQFWTIIFAFCIAGSILPQILVVIFTWIAVALLCFSAALWILELAEDHFYTAQIDKKNKAVLVTGCDTGFGHAFAKLMHSRGYYVYACCYDKHSDGASLLRDTCGTRLKIIQLDVTKDESVEKALKFVESSLGKTELWAIVNNAGVLKGFHTELCSMKDYEDCIQVNVLGMIRVTRAFLPLLRRSKGRIVNVCSLAGRFRSPFLGPYTTSKTAAVAFTEVLRQEMREFGVRAISIEPEFFKTPMCSEKYLQNVLDQSLAEVSEDIKSSYGSKYIEEAKHIYLSLFSRNCENVKPVFDAIEAAVSLQNPADVYKPCRNIYIKILFMTGERVAVVFNEIFIMVSQYFMGLPAPRTGISLLARFLKM